MFKAGFKIIAISTDSEYSHQAWLNSKGLGKLNYPLGADTKHEVSKAYQIYDEEIGAALRGTYIIDPKGFIRYESIYALGVGRNCDELLRVTQALTSNKLCGAKWKPGEPHL